MPARGASRSREAISIFAVLLVGSKSQDGRSIATNDHAKITER